MFIPPLKIGEVIPNGRLAEIFFVANMGGMRYSSKHHVLVLISNHYLKRINPLLNPFDDKLENGVLYYTGEGNLGDQGPQPKGQNKRLINGDYDALYLFEVFNKGQYTYEGEVELVRPHFYGAEHKNGVQPDSNGNLRNVFIFPLRPI